MSWTQYYPFYDHSTVPNQPSTFDYAFSAHRLESEQNLSRQGDAVPTSVDDQSPFYSSAPSCFGQGSPAPIWKRRNSQSVAGVQQPPEMSLSLPQITVSLACGPQSPAFYPAQRPPTVLVPSEPRPWDPIVDMHLAQEECRSAGSSFVVVQSHAPQASGSGYLRAEEENPFDALDLENPAGESPWTMSWTVEWNGIDPSQATLDIKLFREGILSETIKMEACSSIVGSQTWNLGVLTRLGIARTCINIRALSAERASTGELIKEEDCQRFATEIIFALTHNAVPIPGI